MPETTHTHETEHERIVIYPRDYDVDTQSELFQILRKLGVRFSSLKYA